MEEKYTHFKSSLEKEKHLYPIFSKDWKIAKDTKEYINYVHCSAYNTTKLRAESFYKPISQFIILDKNITIVKDE